MAVTIPRPSGPLTLSRLEDYLLAHWDASQRLKLVLCGADDADSLRAVAHVEKAGLIQPVLMGSRSRIRRIMDEHDIRIPSAEVVNSTRPATSLQRTMRLVADGQVDLIMRGRITMHEFLKHLLGGPLKREFIPAGNVLTHVGVFENVNLPRPILVSDGGVIIRPDLNKKVKIIQNAIEIAAVLGLERPRVALLAAVETVLSGMPTSLEDAIISKMADRGQIQNAVIDGPLSIDVALEPDVAKAKGVVSPVAGAADVLIVDKIELGNAVYKALLIFGRSLAAGILHGGKVPVVITSRSDDLQNKILSICLSVLTRCSS